MTSTTKIRIFKRSLGRVTSMMDLHEAQRYCRSLPVLNVKAQLGLILWEAFTHELTKNSMRLRKQGIECTSAMDKSEREHEMMEQGLIPQGWTELVECLRCGIMPSETKRLGLVDDCPWCRFDWTDMHKMKEQAAELREFCQGL